MSQARIPFLWCARSLPSVSHAVVPLMIRTYRFLSIAALLFAVVPGCAAASLDAAATLETQPASCGAFLATPTAVVTSFATTDTGVVVAFSLSGAVTGDIAAVTYITPAGQVYAPASGPWDPVTASEAAASHLCFWDASLLIAGTEVAGMQGRWSVKISLNNVVLTTLPFTIGSGSPTSGALFTFNNFASTAGLTLVGSAATTSTGDGTVLRLTPATGDQSGAAYSTTPVTLGNNATFSTHFQFRFTSPGGWDPADGITFVLATSSTGLGASGGGMGYSGVGGKSVAIEFDTYNNTGFGLGNDDGNSSNHVSIDTNGNLTNTDLTNVYNQQSCGLSSGTPAQNSYAVPGCMSNGDLWTATINYDGASLTVIVTDPAEGSSFTAINGYAINLASLLGQGTAFVGFTAGTGAGWENHDIVNWTFANAAQSICTYSLSPASAAPGAASATGAVTVTAGAGCTWTAVSNVTWIAITSGASGSGNGAVNYTVAANTGAARTGTLTIGGLTFTVSQAAAASSACSYNVSPTSIHATAAGLSSALLVSTNAGCAWTATVPSGVAWIALNPTSGSGAGAVGYSIPANTGAARTATITVAGVAVAVTQDAASNCTYTLSATSSPLISGVGGVGTVTVTVAGTGCAAWNVATPPVSWVHVSAGRGSTSSGSVSYSVDSNSANSSRTATLTIANQSYTVQQAAAPCTYALGAAASGTLAAAGANGSFQVIAAGTACTWSITLPSDPASQWIHVTSALNAMLSGTVSYTIDPNNTTSPRSLALTLNGKNPATTLTYTVSQAAGTASTAPGPIVNPNGVVNAASFISANLPAGSIAQGSFFSIFGNGLGPANPGLSATSYPLGVSLGGVSVKVTQGSTSVNAIPLFVAQYQINAVMPSNTPTGTVQVTVSYGGLTSAPASVQVVPANFGAFTVSGGRGPGIVQNYVSDTQTPLNMTTLTASPGDTVILWGTGLGPLPAGASDTQPAPAGSLPVSVQVLLGNLTIQPLYAGRAPALAGVDQIDFQIPASAALGCYVPLQVLVNGNASNTVTIAINNNRQPCSDTSPFSGPSRSGGKNATIGLARLSYTDPTNAFKIGNGTVDVGLATFNQSSGTGALGFSVFASLPPLNTCTYYNNVGGLNGLLGGQMPSNTSGATPLDAGPTITLQGPNGTEGASYSDSSAQVSPYLGVLGTSGGWTALGLGPTTPFLDPGTYTVSGAGGKDVGPFQYTMKIAAGATWTNRDSIAAVDRTKPLTILWSGGNPSTQAIAIIGYSSNPAANVSGAFACLSDVAPQSFTVPSNFLANLPATPVPNPGNAISALVFVTVPNASQFVTFSTSAPPALDSGLGFYAVGELRNNVAFQ